MWRNRIRDTAEQTRVQFKERVTRDNKYDVSCETVAQSNSRGGVIVVGIDDKTGRINPLSFYEVQETKSIHLRQQNRDSQSRVAPRRREHGKYQAWRVCAKKQTAVQSWY